MSDSAIPIVILAAGGSRRLQQPKQLVVYRGTTLLRRAAITALDSRVGPVLVVLGAEAERCREELDGLRVDAVVNPLWGEGLGASIRLGVQAARARHPELAGVLLMACDQPGVDAAMLRELAAAQQRACTPMAACRYAGAVGVPALFMRGELAALEALIGDKGARTLLAARGADVVTVDCPAALLDVDTPDDLTRLEGGSPPV